MSEEHISFNWPMTSTPPPPQSHPQFEQKDNLQFYQNVLHLWHIKLVTLHFLAESEISYHVPEIL